MRPAGRLERQADGDLLEQLAALLARPDPPELAGRGHRLILEGEGNRRKTRLRPLVRAWLEHRHFAVDGGAR